ncbi:MAG: HDOD domain-containing protein [Deltaproteobacteria bacterium]|nr:HDOD domain-containing protein [Deltaproteobacteria bacterium]
MLNTVALDDIVARIGDLPAIPKVAERVMRMVDDPHTTAHQLQKVLDTDVAIAARILKIANSAFYGYRGRIQSTSQAVMVLGFKTLKSIVLAASMKAIYKRFGLTEQKLWEHSVGVSIGSRIIAQETKYHDPDEAFLVGLMHDVGKVVMNNCDPMKFSLVIQMVYNKNVAASVAEKEIFGFTHKEVGSLVVKKWKLSETIGNVIYYHDNPKAIGVDPYLLKLASVVYLADRMCLKLGIGYRAPKPEVDIAGDDVLSILGLSSERADILFEMTKTFYETEFQSFSA